MSDQPDISVVIVNYNVEYFLEQCLNSVFKALENISGEVFVVDNNSVDGSVEMVKKKFPQVRLIANKDNRGFSKANNQAIEIAVGRYILLLNPDTVVEEDTFQKVVAFMDEHPEAGGLGVRMLDGKGNFLPESKRGLPTPSVAFYKIFGLSALFPKSKIFGKYHLGYLSEFEINEIEVLSGAFMLMRKETLDKVGLLDEAFFMYGEDIDLSYRIILGGYKNYYFPDTRIIHYKGESTKKSSVNYVFVFYRAMVIFARKHFSEKNAKFFSFFIHLAIYLRAGMAITSRFVKRLSLPVVDYLFLLGGALSLTNYWNKAGIEFTPNIFQVSIPVYTLIWITGVFYSGGYDKPIKLPGYIKGALAGMLIILITYGLLPKEWQFSRLYILIGTCWTIAYYFISRIFLHFSVGKSFNLFGNKNQKFAVVGSEQESARVCDILQQTNAKIDSIVYISPSEEKYQGHAGTISQLDQIVFLHKIDEVIFCAKDCSAQEILNWMSLLGSSDLDFKIAQPDSLFLIGSNSIETAGDMYVLNINNITQQNNIRNKRTFDLLASFILLLGSPVMVWFYKQKGKWFSNILSCLFGKKSLVGYDVSASAGNQLQLPKIKKGILFPTMDVLYSGEGLYNKINLIYARDYSVLKDLKILLKNWKKLDS